MRQPVPAEEAIVSVLRAHDVAEVHGAGRDDDPDDDPRWHSANSDDTLQTQTRKQILKHWNWNVHSDRTAGKVLGYFSGALGTY